MYQSALYYVRVSLVCEVNHFLFDSGNRVILASAVAHKVNFDNHKSVLLAEADEIPGESGGNAGGFDVRALSSVFRT